MPTHPRPPASTVTTTSTNKELMDSTSRPATVGNIRTTHPRAKVTVHLLRDNTARQISIKATTMEETPVTDNKLVMGARFIHSSTSLPRVNTAMATTHRMVAHRIMTNINTINTAEHHSTLRRLSNTAVMAMADTSPHNPDGKFVWTACLMLKEVAGQFWLIVYNVVLYPDYDRRLW